MKKNILSLLTGIIFLAFISDAFSQTSAQPFPSLSQDEKQACPAGWGLDTKLKLPEQAKDDRRIDRQSGIGRQLVNRRYRTMDTILKHRQVDGKEGRDLIELPSAGFINIDGVTVISYEIIKLENDKPNAITILAPGLGTLDNLHAEVSGDADMDTVYLDGCLTWDKPAPIEGDDKKLRYIATDSNQKQATVDIAKNLPVELLSPVRILQWQGHISGEPFTPEIMKFIHENDAREMKSRQLAETVWPYKPNKAENILNYRKWVWKIPDKNAQRAMSTVIDLMEKDVLPSEFPNHATIQPLLFDPDVTTIRNVQAGFDCKKDHFRDWLASAPMLMIGNGVNLNCSGNEHYIFTGDADDIVETKDYAFNVWVPGKGNDTLKSGKSSNIVVLADGWGTKTIENTCIDPQERRKSYNVSASPETRFGGIGLSLTKKEDTIVSTGVFKHFPADNAGLKAGDVIIAVDDKPTAGLEVKPVTEMIRGLAGTEVKISFQSPPSNDVKTVVIRRKLVDIQPSQDRYRVDYKPALPFNNYIIFESGISSSDIEEVATGTWRNKRSGDVLKVPDCYNFVFADDTSAQVQQRAGERVAESTAKRDVERNRYPVAPTIKPAQEPICPKPGGSAKDVLKQYPIVMDGQFLADGTFQRNKIYKGFRERPIEFGDSLKALDKRPDQPVVVLANLSGGKLDAHTCGALVYQDSNFHGFTFGDILAEATLYESEAAVKINNDLSDKSEYRRDGTVSNFLIENGDYLYLMQRATDLLYKTIDEEASSEQDNSRHQYFKDLRERCGSQVESSGQELTSELKSAILKGFKLLGTTSGGPTPSVHAPLRLALTDIGNAFLNLQEYNAALYTLCGLDSSKAYLSAALGAKRHDLIEGENLRSLYSLHDMDLSGLVLKKISAGGEWKNINVKGTSFINASFGDTKFQNVNLAESILYGALYNCKTEFPEGFDPVAAHMIPVWKNQGCDAKEQPKVNLAGIDIGVFHKMSNENNATLRRGYLSSEDPLKLHQEYDTLDLPGSVIFSNVDAQKSNLGRVVCSGCIIDGANFTGSRINLQMQDRIVKISNSSFRDADLSGSDFHQMHFINVDFSGANLTDVNFDRATFDSNTKWPEGFDPEKAGMTKSLNEE